MLVYRSGEKHLAVRDALSDLETRLSRLEWPASSALDEIRSLLIDAGELETGLVDRECADEDDTSPLASALGGVVCALADVFVRVWCESPDVAIDAARRSLRSLRSYALPSDVQVSTAEGLAFYGLFPETYIDATNALLRGLAPPSAVVVGIRSIGTTLSAVVTAALRARGVECRRLTVRPRGHPFDRRLRLSQRLSRELRQCAARPSTLFVIVDEGPGLSGSSFASVVEKISALGVSDDRIVLVPSWNPDPRVLSSARARRIWPRHARFIGDFDRLWLCSRRLESAFGGRILAELSAGAWRERFFAPKDGPAIQPQHERRKYLLQRESGERVLIKFEGLDRGARERRARAEHAATAGFAAPVHGAAHGFLVSSWIDGVPLDARDVTPELLRRMARYLAWISRRERSARAADPIPLMEMLRVNAEEALGPEWADSAVGLTHRSAHAIARAPAVRVDGRMLPHEWLRTSDSWIKTDVASHFDDHFYPGETDVAWDIAATIIEFDLNGAETQSLVREYELASGDREIATRLAFMRAAYAAFRLGYTTLGAEALGSGADANRLRHASCRYANVLRDELSTADVVGQSCATGT